MSSHGGGHKARSLARMRAQEAERPVECAKDFLRMLEAFNTSSPQSSKRTRFAKLLTAGLGLEGVNSKILMQKFNVTTSHIERARKDHSTGIESQDRKDLIDFLKEKALSIIG